MSVACCPDKIRLARLLALLLLTLGSVLAWGRPAADEGGAPERGCKHLTASGNAEYPPYLWRDPTDPSHLIGANADLLQMMAKLMGISIEVKYVGPWARVQEAARLGQIDLIAGAFWTLPRAEYMDYFHPAMRETQSVVWVRQDSRIQYRRWSDLVTLQGVTVINNSFGEDFDRYAKTHLKISQVASLEQAIQMLHREHADYLIYEDSPGQAYMARMGINDLKALTPSVANENLHVTLSHRSPCNTGEVRGAIAQALYKLNRQNAMASLLETNIQRWRHQQQHGQ